MTNTPPGFSPYPRANYNSNGGRPPGIYFDILGEAWALVRENLGVLLPSMILYIVLAVAVTFLGNFGISWAVYGTFFPTDQQLDQKFVAHQALSLIPNMVSWALIQGVYYQSLKIVRHEEVSVADIFSGFRHFLMIVAAQLVILIGMIIGIFLCILPGFLFYAITSFFGLVIIDRDEGPLEAIATCFRTFRPVAFPLLAFIVAYGFIGALGLICCVGVLFTMPITTIAFAMTYNYYFPPKTDDANMRWIGEAPPR